MAALGRNRWLLAARPATLGAAVSPVLVGSALAGDDGVFAWDRFAAVLVAALLIQIGVNFANDLSDAVRGVDDERVGPARAVAGGLVTPIEMRWAIVTVLAIATVPGAYLAWRAGPVVLVIGVVSVIAALAYTGGPLPYGYRALGELSVLLFFGLVATVGTRFVYDRSTPVEAWVGGVVMGLLAAAILVANNLRDIATDAAAGKRTLAVLLGDRRTRRLYATTVAGAFAVLGAGAAAGWLPPWSALGLLAAPTAWPLVRSVVAGTGGTGLIAVLVGTARTQLATAALLAAGAIL